MDEKKMNNQKYPTYLILDWGIPHKNVDIACIQSNKWKEMKARTSFNGLRLKMDRIRDIRDF